MFYFIIIFLDQGGDMWCEQFKLQLWSLVNFDKIVYLNYDMMVLKNIDNVFDEYGEFGAVQDFVPDTFNTGTV